MASFTHVSILFIVSLTCVHGGEVYLYVSSVTLFALSCHLSHCLLLTMVFADAHNARNFIIL